MHAVAKWVARRGARAISVGGTPRAERFRGTVRTERASHCPPRTNRAFPALEPVKYGPLAARRSQALTASEARVAVGAGPCLGEHPFADTVVAERIFEPVR